MILIEAISARREGINLKDLAQAIDCSSAATYHLVQTLADSGFVRRLESPARYVLGDKLLNLLSNESKDRYYNIVHDEMLHLQKQLPGSSLFYSEYIGNHITVRSQINANNPTQIQRPNNYVLPPYLSAGSVVHLAFWTSEMADEYQELYPFETYSRVMWDDWETYEAILSQTRKDGCVLVPEKNPLNLKLGLPILGKDNALMAALTVQWNQTQRKGMREKIKTLKQTALATGQRITQRLQGNES
jgi:DNA-binding IclR family transcriptional regulator